MSPEGDAADPRGSAPWAALERALTPSLVVEDLGDRATVVFANARVRALLGRDVPRGTPLAEVVHDAGGGGHATAGNGRFEAVMVRADQLETSVRLQVDALAGHGRRRLTLVQVDAAHSAAGISQALWESQERLQTILDNVDALAYLKDADGRYLLINSCFAREQQIRREDIVGMTDVDIFGEEVGRFLRANDSQVLAAGHSMSFEEPVHGDAVYISTKFPVFDSDGTAYAVGGISTDITDRSQAEKVIIAARDEAQRANAAKTEFLSRMSHELRTPLNSILGFGRLLVEDLDGAAGERAERIVQAGQHLLGLIDEVLDISRIEHVGPDVSVEPIGAVEAFQEAMMLVRPLADCRGIELVRDFHGGLDVAVLANARRLTQVLLNLLGNAVKYNRDEGLVSLSFRRERGRLTFLVSDTGRGLYPQEIDRIFAPFERLDAARTGVEGTGLGLALSRSLVEAMGGHIGVERSKPGRGSIFFVNLPIAEGVVVDPVGASVGDRADVDLGGLRFLYVEDEPANVDLMQQVLARYGVAVLPVSRTGREGIARTRGEVPDLVLLDLNLPDMSGEHVLTELRADPVTQGVPVVVLSADAMDSRIRQMREAGADAYLTKPVDARLLARTLADLTGRTAR